MILSTDPISDFKFQISPISDSDPIWYIKSLEVLLIKNCSNKLKSYWNLTHANAIKCNIVVKHNI